jgi:hypothetical protein
MNVCVRAVLLMYPECKNYCNMLCNFLEHVDKHAPHCSLQKRCVTLAVPARSMISKCSRASLHNELRRHDIGMEVAIGGNIDQFDHYGYTPLYWTVAYGNVTIMEWLLNFGARPNVLCGDARVYNDYRRYPVTAIDLAISMGSSPLITQRLIQAGSEPGISEVMPSYMNSCCNNRWGVLRRLWVSSITK